MNIACDKNCFFCHKKMQHEEEFVFCRQAKLTLFKEVKKYKHIYPVCRPSFLPSRTNNQQYFSICAGCWLKIRGLMASEVSK